MSKLDELIKELCPAGVEYRELGSVTVEINIGINPRAFFKLNPDNACGYYVTVRELNGLAGVQQYEKTDKISQEAISIINSRANIEKGDVLFSNTGTVGRMAIVVEDPKCWGVNEGIYVIKPNHTIIITRFLYYYLDSHHSYSDYSAKLTGSTLKHVTQAALKSIKIPLPPLPVQHEIVRILDTFTELTAELIAELTARKKQYEYYSNTLLDIANADNPKFRIGEVCKLEKGMTPIQKAVPGDYPMVVTTSERKSNNEYQFDSPSVCIPLVSSRGHGVASLSHVYYQEGKFALGNILCALTPKIPSQLSAKYLYYYFEQTKDYTLVPFMKGGANVALRMEDIEKVKINIPPLQEQNRIVSILDRFDTLCNDITTGLPAEIEARKKQYEYYRDKLLTFPEAKA